MQHVPRLIRDLVPYLDQYGYFAVFGAILLEDFGVPMPGETMLIADSVVASLGRLFIVWVLLIAFLGAVVGDNIGYAIGYFGGRRVVLRFGRYVFLTEERLNRAEKFFERHGGKVVTVARFIEGFRQLNGIVAGTSRMKWRRFLAFNALGAALWVGVWGSAGYFLGSNIGAAFSLFKRFELYFLAGLGIVLALLLIRYLLRRSRRNRNPDGKT